MQHTPIVTWHRRRMAAATQGDISSDRNHYFVINNGPTSLNDVYTTMLDEMTHRSGPLLLHGLHDAV